MSTVASGVVVAERARPDLEVIFHQDYARLVGALFVLCGNRYLAEEAVQEAFLRAHKHWPRIAGYDDPSGWIRRAAVNRLRSIQVSPWHRLRQSLPAEQTRSPGGTDLVTLPLALQEAMRALPRKQRLAVVLFHVAGYPLREVACAMDISEGSVKQHLSRARTKLRAALEDEI